MALASRNGKRGHHSNRSFDGGRAAQRALVRATPAGAKIRSNQNLFPPLLPPIAVLPAARCAAGDRARNTSVIDRQSLRVNLDGALTGK
jgi:hypothetical protein